MGAGGVGGYFGGLLARAGHDVTLIARGAHLEAIRAQGLRVEGVEERFTVKAPASDDPRQVGPVDLVLYCVKTYHNATAIPLLPPLLRKDTVVLTLQNGVSSAQELAAVLGPGPILTGAVYIEVTIREPGVIVQSGGPRRIVFGEPVGGPSPRARRLCDVLVQAGIRAEVAEDTRRALWTKFMFLASFAALTGLSRAPAGKLRADPETRELLVRAMEEVLAVGQAHGVPLEHKAVSEALVFLDSVPASFTSSLHRDLDAGRPLELEVLSGDIWRLGREASVATPVHELFYRCLKIAAAGSAPRSQAGPGSF